MWQDILESNSGNIQEAFEEFYLKVTEMRQSIAGQKETCVETIFAEGREMRASLADPGKNYSGFFHEVLAQIPDQPGTILKALQPIYNAGINIRDIELLKVREGIAGTLLLAFKTEADAKSATDILNAAHIPAKIR
jgi:prephenate dehydrogenase